MRLSTTPESERIIIGQPAVSTKEITTHPAQVCLGVLEPDADASDSDTVQVVRRPETDMSPVSAE